MRSDGGGGVEVCGEQDAKSSMLEMCGWALRGLQREISAGGLSGTASASLPD